MDAEEIEQLNELEELLDAGEELDEDDRETLRELRAQARYEKRQAEALARFNKAKTVFMVEDDDGDPSYFLDLATASRWGTAEEVERASLPGRFRFAWIEGYMTDGNYGRDEVYAIEE